MPPLLRGFAISQFRYYLAMLFAWLIERGFVDPVPEAGYDEFIMFAATGLSLGLWSLWERYWARIRFWVALRSGATVVTPKQVDQIARGSILEDARMEDQELRETATRKVKEELFGKA